MECRIRHMIVRYFASEWRVKSLLRKYGKLYKGEYSSFPTQPSHTPQNHRHQPLFILEDAAGDMAIRFLQWAADDRQVSQSGKPLCTGASLWAVPNPAMRASALEPRHVNKVSNPAKMSIGHSFEDLLIDQDAVLHLYKGALHSLIYPLLIYQPEMLWLILFMERRMKKGVKNLCEKTKLYSNDTNE